MTRRQREQRHKRAVFHTILKDSERTDLCWKMVEFRLTLRDIEEHYGVPKSTMNYWIHNTLRTKNDKLYTLVKRQMAKNRIRSVEEVNGKRKEARVAELLLGGNKA